MTKVIFILVIFLISCGNKKENQETAHIEPAVFFAPENEPVGEPADESPDDFFRVIEIGENYRVVQLHEEPGWEWRYEIFNNAGEVVFEHESFRGGFKYVGENLLQFHLGAGTYAWSQIYYCPREDILSEEFGSSFFLKDRLIAQFTYDENNERGIIVRDIFDPEIFYAEFSANDYVDDLHFSASGDINYLGNNEIEISGLFRGEDFSETSFIICIDDSVESATQSSR